jgi:hypothetical protein
MMFWKYRLNFRRGRDLARRNLRRAWRENLKKKVDAAMLSPDGIQSLTSKLDIGQNSIYVKTAWLNGRVVHLDITLSRGGRSALDGLPKSAAVVEASVLEATNYDQARSWVEEVCRMASRMLEGGADIGDVISEWRGIRGFPSGPCPQLESVVPGPLHAAAILIESRIEDWKKQLTNHNATQ